MKWSVSRTIKVTAVCFSLLYSSWSPLMFSLYSIFYTHFLLIYCQHVNHISNEFQNIWNNCKSLNTYLIDVWLHNLYINLSAFIRLRCYYKSITTLFSTTYLGNVLTVGYVDMFRTFSNKIWPIHFCVILISKPKYFRWYFHLLHTVYITADYFVIS